MTNENGSRDGSRIVLSGSPTFGSVVFMTNSNSNDGLDVNTEGLGSIPRFMVLHACVMGPVFRPVITFAFMGMLNNR